MNLSDIADRQRAYFNTEVTKDQDFRNEALQKLLQALISNEAMIRKALKTDLNKSGFEAYMTEIGMVRDECRFAVRHALLRIMCLFMRAGSKS